MNYKENEFYTDYMEMKKDGVGIFTYEVERKEKRKPGKLPTLKDFIEYELQYHKPINEIDLYDEDDDWVDWIMRLEDTFIKDFK